MPGIWHTKMEYRFPETMREVKFYYATKVYNTCRRADILLSNNRTCEIQHSYISQNEIVKRFNDWNTFGKEIIWLIDGNEGIEMEKLSSGNYLIRFKQDWKYKSFKKRELDSLSHLDIMMYNKEIDEIHFDKLIKLTGSMFLGGTFRGALKRTLLWIGTLITPGMPLGQ